MFRITLILLLSSQVIYSQIPTFKEFVALTNTGQNAHQLNQNSTQSVIYNLHQTHKEQVRNTNAQVAAFHGLKVPEIPPSATNDPQGYQRWAENYRKQYEQDTRKTHLDEILLELRQQSVNDTLLTTRFTSRTHLPQAQPYLEGANRVATMLLGKSHLSVKEAVFWVEYAHDPTLSKTDFFRKLDEATSICKQWMENRSLPMQDDLAKHFAIQTYFQDTIRINNQILSYPFEYDFDDIFGRKDWTNMFVSKLLDTHRGQCHSMPLLYLILAEELDTECYISFSPSHMYIKFRNRKGELINYETTNGSVNEDGFIIQSGYVAAESVKSGMYMQPLTNKEVVVQCLIDLAQGYAINIGMDDFVLSRVNYALQLHPTNPFGLMLKSDYYTLLLKTMSDGQGLNTQLTVERFPEAKKVFMQRNKLYDLLDRSGLTQMPEEDYKNWLGLIENKRQEQYGTN